MITHKLAEARVRAKAAALQYSLHTSPEAPHTAPQGPQTGSSSWQTTLHHNALSVPRTGAAVAMIDSKSVIYVICNIYIQKMVYENYL